MVAVSCFYSTWFILKHNEGYALKCIETSNRRHGSTWFLKIILTVARLEMF